MMWRKTSDFCVKWVYVCTVQAAEGVEYPAVVSLSLSGGGSDFCNIASPSPSSFTVTSATFERCIQNFTAYCADTV